MIPGTVLVLGGARAGKSAFAIARAHALAADGGRVAFVATAEPGDTEMVARIARHRAERPPQWATVEAPRTLVAALDELRGKADIVVVDCLTLWVANRLADGEPSVLAEARRLGDLAARPPFALIVVSNAVGLGVHPETALGRQFRDALGLVNQAVAGVAHEVVLLVAGRPLWFRDGP